MIPMCMMIVKSKTAGGKPYSYSVEDSPNPMDLLTIDCRVHMVRILAAQLRSPRHSFGLSF